MGLWDLLKAKRTTGYIDSALTVEIEKVGTASIPDKLTNENAYLLANLIPEVYFAVDFIADRASKLRYFITDSKGVEITNTELNRFLTSINPIYQFSDLVYQSIFNYLSDGNMIHYVQSPKSYAKVNVNSISRIDVLQPDLLSLLEYNNISSLQIAKLTDFIRTARYDDMAAGNNYLEAEQLRIYGYDSMKRDQSHILTKSPLFKASVAIDNLLAVYSARYNVYVNNGAAGYLVKKSTAGVESILKDRQDIIEEINRRDGLTGKRNLKGISSVPLEFINTLVTIKDLMPMEETLENTIKIGGVFQIPAGLMPRKDQTTFANRDTDERTVWENSLMSIVDSFCEYWANTTGMNKLGYKVAADYSTVSVLNDNVATIEDIKAKKIANIKSLKELQPDADFTEEINLIIESYGKE